MKLMITGINGRMGQQVALAALETQGVEITAAPARNQAILGKEVGEVIGTQPIGVAVKPLAEIDFHGIDAVIDFTLPQALPEWLALCQQHRLPFITGTTGLSAEQQRQVEQASQQIPIVQSFNMSLGVNLLAALVEKASAALDDSFDIEILEMHHRHKKDAPSGTARLLGEAAAKGRDVSLTEKQAIDRDGLRQSGDIGFAVMRGGGVIGDHHVVLAGQSERIELTHRGHDRSIYAKGALQAAKWLQGKPAGLYSMRDVLSL